jgi:hypothetical protein
MHSPRREVSTAPEQLAAGLVVLPAMTHSHSSSASWAAAGAFARHCCSRITACSKSLRTYQVLPLERHPPRTPSSHVPCVRCATARRVSRRFSPQAAQARSAPYIYLTTSVECRTLLVSKQAKRNSAPYLVQPPHPQQQRCSPAHSTFSAFATLPSPGAVQTQLAKLLPGSCISKCNC